MLKSTPTLTILQRYRSAKMTVLRDIPEQTNKKKDLITGLTKPGPCFAAGSPAEGCGSSRLFYNYHKDSMGWLFASNEKTTIAMQQVHTQVCKNNHDLPKHAILLGVLKAIEKELARRGLLEPTVDQAMPLWFLAETERNVFLWRHGRSIDDCREFSFWVDVPALIDKRRKHLSRCRGFNPFVCGSPDETGAQHELRYLDQIEDMADSILSKAALVSRASESLQHELEPARAFCTRVVLPYRADAVCLPA